MGQWGNNIQTYAKIVVEARCPVVRHRIGPPTVKDNTLDMINVGPITTFMVELEMNIPWIITGKIRDGVL